MPCLDCLVSSRPRGVARAAIALVFLVLACLARASAAEPPGEKPARYNVLFIAVDDLRPQLGCYGVESMHTPNLDRLAREGIVFTRAYCQQALCNPSRASLLTGLRPDSTKIYGLSTHFRATIPEVVALPQHFKEHGYRTEGLSKIYHGGLDDPRSWSRPHWAPNAPTYFDEATRQQIRETRRRLESEGIATSKRPLQTDPATGTVLKLSGRHTVHGPSWEAPDVPDGDLYDGKTAQRAVELLREYQGKDTPFFLAVGFIRPHLPFIAPKRYFDLYPPEKITLASHSAPEGAPEIALHNSGELRGYTDIPDEGPIDEETLRKVFRAYCASASFVDALVGQLLDELDRLGLRENTVVVLWGDHGWHLGEQDIWGKMTNFEVATRAPLILSFPGQPRRGARTTALVEFVDIYPTLCELCGLPLPADLEGRSLVPLAAEPDRPWKKAAFSQYPRAGGHMGYSMRTDRYRYTEWRQGDTVVARELYDYQTDPEGNVNLADRPDQSGLVAQLSRQLAEGWRSALP